MKRISTGWIIVLSLGVVAASVLIPLLVVRSQGQPSISRVLGKPPAQIGEMSLYDYTEGERALVSINRLHRKKIDLREGLVAQYRNGGGAAMVWIGAAAAETDAAALIARMVGKIKAGSEVFEYERQFTRRGMEVYQLNGMGQRHYIYQRSEKVIWVSLDPGVDEGFLTNATAQIR